jgi:predicted RecB family nuclease
VSIPATFVFSQTSLGDYRACARRFQLRYLERLAWPAPRSADALEAERHMRLGQEFHRLARRHQNGLPAATLTPLAGGDVDLANWWTAYLASPYATSQGPVCRAELTLSAPLAGFRLEAMYDLLVGAPGGDWLIVDWKTERHRPERRKLETRLQTTVYRCVLALAGAALNGGPLIAPERVRMAYWFAAFPLQAEEFAYDSVQHENDLRLLAGLIAEIAARPTGDWSQTDDERNCRFCDYRTFCTRQVQLATWDELEAAGEAAPTLPSDLDLDKVEEIAF